MEPKPAPKPETPAPHPAKPMVTTPKALAAPPVGLGPTGKPTRTTVMEALRPIHDPELMISIVDLGLVYDAVVSPDGKKIEVSMTLTSPGCPIGPELMAAVDHTTRMIPGVESAEVKLVWEPAWDPTKMASDVAKEQLGIW